MVLTGAIRIPLKAGQLRCSAAGFSALSELHADMMALSDADVIIDCSKLTWMDAHLAAPFMAVVQHSLQKNNKPKLGGLDRGIRAILQKNGTLETKAADTHGTTIPLSRFGLSEEVGFAKFSRKYLSRSEMPRMSASLRNKIYEGFDELFANCALHSQSPTNVVAVGQFFPRLEKLAFAISDGGRGVDGSLRDSGIPYGSPEDAIDWAMASHNTTRRGDIPGGLGLKLLRDFISKNNGRLVVVSSAGYWSQQGARIRKSRLSSRFPGTTVIVEINTSDKKSYELKAEPDPQNIW